MKPGHEGLGAKPRSTPRASIATNSHPLPTETRGCERIQAPTTPDGAMPSGVECLDALGEPPSLKGTMDYKIIRVHHNDHGVSTRVRARKGFQA